MKREYLTPSKLSRVCAEFFTEDAFEQIFTVMSLLGLSFKPCQRPLKKDAVLTICNLTVARWKPVMRQENNGK